MSAHSSAPWTTEHGLIYSAEGHVVASCVDEDGELCHPIEGPHDVSLIAAAPRLVDAIFDLLVALGKHTPGFTPEQLADICPACDEATAALVATGRVIA